MEDDGLDGIRILILQNEIRKRNELIDLLISMVDKMVEKMVGLKIGVDLDDEYKQFLILKSEYIKEE